MARTERINLRLDREERLALRRVARAVKQSPSSWARMAVVNALRQVQLATQNPQPPIAA